MTFKIKHWLFCGAAVVALPSAVYAQPADTVETITVTGSRVISDAANSPTPLTIVSAEDLLATTPTALPDGLNKLPIFQGSQTIGRPGDGQKNYSSNTLNLRNFGGQRTLVLLDGHRAAPATLAALGTAAGSGLLRERRSARRESLVDIGGTRSDDDKKHPYADPNPLAHCSRLPEPWSTDALNGAGSGLRRDKRPRSGPLDVCRMQASGGAQRPMRRRDHEDVHDGPGPAARPRRINRPEARLHQL